MTYNLGTLEADTQSWLENNSAEITANILTICNMAMQTISKDVRVKAMNFIDTSITFSNGTATYLIPNNATLLGMKTFSFQIGGAGSKYQPLMRRNISWLDEYWKDRAVVGTASLPPKYYAVDDDSNFVIAPTPYTTMATKIRGRKQFAQLVNASDTNYIITNHYDFALTAVMREASRFIIDDRQGSLLAINSAQYDALRDSINEMEKRTERDEDRVPSLDRHNAPKAPPDSEAA